MKKTIDREKIKLAVAIVLNILFLCMLFYYFINEDTHRMIFWWILYLSNCITTQIRIENNN